MRLYYTWWAEIDTYSLVFHNFESLRFSLEPVVCIKILKVNFAAISET